VDLPVQLGEAGRRRDHRVGDDEGQATASMEPAVNLARRPSSQHQQSPPPEAAA